MSISGLLLIWRSQRWFVIAVMTIGAIFGYSITNSLSSSYEAGSDILLSATNYEARYGELGALNAFEFEQVLSTKTAIIEKPAIHDAAAASLGLTSGEDLPADYSATREPGTQIVRVTATAGDADDAVDAVNAVVTVFIDQENTLAQAAAQARLDELNTRVTATQTRLDEASEEIERLENSLARTTDSTSVALETLISDRNATSQVLASERLLRDRAAGDLADAADAVVALNVPDEAQELPPLSPWIGAALAAMVSAFLAVGFAAVRQELSDRIVSSVDVETTMGVRPLAVMPKQRRLRPAARTAQQRRVAARIANRVRARVPGGDTAVVAVAAPRLDGSASAVSEALGLRLAAEGQAVVLVTASLPAPPTRGAAIPSSTSATQPQSDDGNLDEIIPASDDELVEGGGSSVAVAVRPSVGTEKASAMPASGLTTTTLDELALEHAHAGALVDRIQAGIDELSTRYDWVVIESPAALEDTSFMAVVAASNVSLAVATVRKTSAAELAETTSLLELAGTPSAGVVLVGIS